MKSQLRLLSLFAVATTHNIDTVLRAVTMKVERSSVFLIVLLLSCASVSAQTTVMSGPSTFLLATFQAGDQVSVQVQASSCDPDESEENEPVVLQTSTGDFIANIGTYGFTNSYTFKATAAGTLSGFISGADSNAIYCGTSYDESATVTVTTTPHPHRFSQATKDELNATKVYVEDFGASAAAIAFVCAVIPEFVSKVCTVGGGGAAAVAALIVAGIDTALALDPPDLNYKQIAQPVLLTLPLLLPQPGNITQAEANTYNALLLNQEWQLAFVRAIITSENRAQSAHDAGDVFWEAQQVDAIDSYASSLGGYFAAEPALLTNYQSAIVGSGDPAVTLTADQVLSFEDSIAGSGLPPSILTPLNQLGADPATIAQVQELLVVQNASAVAATGGFPIFLTQPGLITALNGAAQALPPALKSGSICNGVYGGVFNGNVSVSKGQTCTFVNGSITGNVQQNGGSLVLAGATVTGNVQINSGGIFSIGPFAVINGDLQIQNIPSGTAQNQVCGATVKGNLQFQNNGTAVQIGSASPACPVNVIGGNLEVHNNTSSTAIFYNTVGGNLQDQNNTASTQVFSNKVTKNLQCQNNSSIAGGGNTAAQKQGQCATF